jgi:predicted nucleic acid-binding protein
VKPVLVDTSAWISHFRDPDAVIMKAILDDSLWTSDLIIAELALGSIPNRTQFLSDLSGFFKAPVSEPTILHAFIDKQKLAATGIGYVDAQLLLSANSCGAFLWTHDKRLRAQAERLDCALQL